MNPEKQDLSSEPDQELTAPTPAKLACGSIFAGTYRILSVLGSGGMGTVYRAEHKLTERVVALKLLHQNLSLDADNLKRFQAEAKTLSHLNHANIVRLLSGGISDEGVPFIVMEELQGETLSTHLEKLGKLPPARIIALTQQLVAALVHAHHVGVIHRDLKPSNIMLINAGTEEENVKVMDFGIAKFSRASTASSDSPTTSGSLKGSPYYMSPEQCRGSHLDGRSDLYALGCIMYQCLTGTVPFDGQTNLDVMYKQINDPAPSFAEEARDQQTRKLQTVIERCLAKDPQNRYASAAKLQEALSGQGSTQFFILGRQFSWCGSAKSWPKVLLWSGLAITISFITMVLISKRHSPLPAAPNKTFDEHPRKHNANPQSKTTSMWIDETKRLLNRADHIGTKKGDDSREYYAAINEALNTATNAIEAATMRKHLQPEERLKLEAKALQMRASVFSHIHELDKSTADLDRAIALSSQCQSQPRAAHLELVSFQAEYYLQKRDLDKALKLSQWVLSEQEKLYGDTPTDPVCMTLRQLIEIYHQLHDNSSSVYYAKKLWKQRKDLSQPSEQAHAIGLLTQAYITLPDLPKAIETAKMWVQLDEQTHAPDDPSHARINLGYAMAMASRNKKELKQGFAIMGQELHKAMRHGNVVITLDAYSDIESALYLHKRYKDLIDILNVDIAMRYRLTKDYWPDAILRFNSRTQAYLALKDFPGAEKSAREAIAAYKPVMDYMITVKSSQPHRKDILDANIAAKSYLFTSLIQQQKFQAALDAARQAKERLRELSMLNTYYYWDACITIAHALLGLNDSAGAEKELLAVLQTPAANIARFPGPASECYRVLSKISDSRHNTAQSQYYGALMKACQSKATRLWPKSKTEHQQPQR